MASVAEKQRPISRDHQPRPFTPRLNDAWICKTITNAFQAAGMQDTRAIHVANRTKSGEPILLFEIPGGSETTVDEREVVLFGRESNVKLFKRILTAAKRSRVLFEERKEYKYNTPDYIKLGTVLEQATEFTVAAHNLVENGSSVDDAITKIAEEDRNNLRLAGFTSDEVESSVKNSVRFAQALLAPSRV